MNYEFGDRSDESSRAQKIRDLFTAGTTIYEHTEFCIREGVWTESEILGMASIQARNEVRDALGDMMAGNVPFAGPTSLWRPPGEGKAPAPVWRQLEFWSKADFDYNYTAYKRRARQNERIAANIAHVCRERYGVDPVDLGENYPLEDEP